MSKHSDISDLHAHKGFELNQTLLQHFTDMNQDQSRVLHNAAKLLFISSILLNPAGNMCRSVLVLFILLVVVVVIIINIRRKGIKTKKNQNKITILYLETRLTHSVDNMTRNFASKFWRTLKQQIPNAPQLPTLPHYIQH